MEFYNRLQNQTILPQCSIPWIQLKTAGLNTVWSVTICSQSVFWARSLKELIHRVSLVWWSGTALCQRRIPSCSYQLRWRNEIWALIHLCDYVTSLFRTWRPETPDLLLLFCSYTSQISVSNYSCLPNKLNTRMEVHHLFNQLKPHHQIKEICDCWFLYEVLGSSLKHTYSTLDSDKLSSDLLPPHLSLQSPCPVWEKGSGSQTLITDDLW